MQIGPTPLPGSKPPPGPAGVGAPADPVAPAGGYAAVKQPRERRLGWAVFLLLLAGAGVAMYALARGVVPLPEGRKAGFGAIARWLPHAPTWRSIVPFWATNGLSRLTTVQQQVAHDYSLADQLAATKRAMAAEAARVRGSTAAQHAHTPSGGVAVVVFRTAAVAVARSATGATGTVPAAIPVVAKSGVTPAVKPIQVWSNVLVSGVIGGPHGRYYARVNRRVVGVGDMVDDMTVTAVSPRSVTLARHGDEREFMVGGEEQ